MRKRVLMDYIDANYIEELDKVKLKMYVECTIDMLNKYTSLYPVITERGGVISKYMPTKEEYLEFERSCTDMVKDAKVQNRKLYGITEEDVASFYASNSLEAVSKSKPRSQIRKDVKKAYNILRPDVEIMCKIFNKIFDTNRECFVRLRCASTNNIYSYNVKDLKDSNKLFNILNSSKFSKEDFFYSVATYKTMLSGEEDNIFSMHLIVVDVDYKNIRRLKGKTPIEILEILKEQEFDKSIPTPNFVEVGHQLRLLYKIEPVGATRLSKNLVKRINKVFSERLVDFGADTSRLTDSARIKGSVNTKDNSTVDIFVLEDVAAYKLSDLKDKWLDEIPDWYPFWTEKKGKNTGKVVKFRPKDKSVLYPLNMGRIEDFKRIASYYGKDLDGRRFLCFLVRNHAMLAGFTEKEAEEMMKEFNKNLAKSLSWRVIERDTRNVNRKQYLYKDITILDHLGITREEVELIGLQELKYQTSEEKALKKAAYNREYRLQQFRNTEGLTKTEVRRRSEFIKIVEMELQGLSYRAIAKELGKDHKTLIEKINNTYKKINYNEIKEMVLELKKQGIKILA